MINLLPKDTVFFDLFEDLASHMVKSAEHLRSLAQNFPSGMDDGIRRIRQEEHDADELSHTALERLDRTFITPFDREDIHQLIGQLDDIIDGIDALSKRFPLYHVKQMEPLFQKQTELLVKSTTAVSKACHQLRQTRKLSELKSGLIEIHHLESLGDDNHHAALSDLFIDGAD